MNYDSCLCVGVDLSQQRRAGARGLLDFLGRVLLRVLEGLLLRKQSMGAGCTASSSIAALPPKTQI